MDREKAREKIFDTMIMLAGRESILEELESLPREEDIEREFSPQFKTKMSKLLGNRRRTRNRLRTFRVLRVMAAAIAIAAILFATAFAFVPEFQEKIMNMLLEWTEKSAKFTFPQGNETGMAVNKPTYIPEGFVESESIVSNSSVYIWYLNSQDDEIMFTQILSEEGHSLSLDNEHSIYSTVDVNGYAGHFFESNEIGNPSYLVFDDGLYAYLLTGEVFPQFLIDMAKSIP